MTQSDLDRARLDQLHDRMLKRSRKELNNAAYKVGVLSHSTREKYVMAFQKWGPQHQAIVAATAKWMTEYQKLRRSDPGTWGQSASQLIAAGERLSNAIYELNRNVTNADWSRTHTFLHIAVKAAAAVPTIVQQAGVKAAEVVGSVGQAAGKAVAGTLAPIKTYLFLAAGVVALIYLGPALTAWTRSRKAAPT